jgi:hypothetical protein
MFRGIGLDIRLALNLTTRGKVGQESRIISIGAPFSQRMRRSRRSGDMEMTCRHFRQTCVRRCHFHERSVKYFKASSRQKSNITRRVSSGSISIVVLRRFSPVPHKSMTVNYECQVWRSPRTGCSNNPLEGAVCGISGT